MAKPRKALSLKGMTPEQEALITRQEVPRIERIEKEEQPKSESVDPPVTESENEQVASVDVNPISDPPKTLVEAENPKEKNPVQKKKSRKKTSPKSPVTEEVAEPWITKTYRLPGSLIERLQMVSLGRRIKKIAPNTQQELLAQALTEWLEKNEE